MKLTLRPVASGIMVILLSTASVLAQAPAQQQQPEFVKQGQQLMRAGKPEEALALYRQTLQTSPDSVPANLAAGSVLDIMGKGEEARKYFTKAIDVADTPEHKAGARRAMAMSYAFEGDCAKTIEYEQQVFDFYGSVKNFFQQGEIADEAARVCLDSGNLDTSSKWYAIGRDTGLKEPDIKPARQDLWNFRWEHAQGRIAARRGDHVEAQKHVAAAKAILDKGTMPEQAQFFPYLKGYVAFYAGDYKAALEGLNQANQNDPFIQCMIGQTYEKIERQAKSLGVLPQSFNGNFAQSSRRIRGSIRQEEAVLAACGLHERRPNQVPRCWLDVSDTRTPAATETLIESQPPLIGMRTRNRRDL